MLLFENPGIVGTVYSGNFRHLQGHSAIFTHVKAYWVMFRHYWGAWGHNQTNSEPWLIWNLRILQKLVKHIRPSCIFRDLAKSDQFTQDTQGYDAYWVIFTGVQLGRGRGETFPALFKNRKNCPDFGKKGPDCVHFLG